MAVVAGSQGASARAGGAATEHDRATSWWLLGAIVVLGAIVRFTTLNEQSFWYDEAMTWGIVAHGPGHVLHTVPRTESTPYTYYVLLWLWAQVFGVGEVGLRSFSALCGVLTIPVVWLIGRRLVSDRVGLIAALLTAVNPLLFWYGQEARSYSLLVLVSALSLLAFIGALRSPTRMRLLVWGLSGALAVAVHYYAAVLVAAEAGWLVAALARRGRPPVGGIALGLAPIVAVGAGLLPLLIRQNDGRAGYIATQEGSLAYRLAQLVKEDIVGQGQPMKALLTALGCLFVATAVLIVVRRCRAAERRAAATMLGIAAGAVALAVLVALVATDYVDPRNLLPTWPALVVAVAVGLGCDQARRAGSLATAGLVVLSLVCVWNIVSNPLFQRPDWRGAARALRAATASRAIVSDLYSEVPLRPYLSSLGPYPATGLARVREVDVIWLQRAYQWGPIAPIVPAGLSGFQRIQTIRTRSYDVVRYRAATPQPESPPALDRLYPNQGSVTALLQRR